MKRIITASRYHDISCGHRVVGHKNKCQHLHGHNYRFHFDVIGEQDDLGMVLDFAVIKDKLCMWIETHWDHKMLLWEEDPLLPELQKIDPGSIVVLPFNPTAENMAKYMCEVVGVEQLAGTGTILRKCTIEETRKCKASYEVVI